jgi:hypothetical protein
VIRCRRDVFTDERLFEAEMKHIFEGNWVYLAHESQIPAVNDYFTTTVGRQPVVITRDKAGSFMPISTPVRIAGPRCAAASMATRAASPARSMAGPSATMASCSR